MKIDDVKEFADVRGNIGTMPPNSFWDLYDVICREAARRMVIHRSASLVHKVTRRSVYIVKYPVGATQVKPLESSWDFKPVLQIEF